MDAPEPIDAAIGDTDTDRDSDAFQGGDHPLFAAAPRSTNFRKLRKRLMREVRQTLTEYAMVRPGGRWLVCLSGGKDSYALLAVLSDLRWRGLLPVDLLACNLDQAQPGFPAHILPEFLDRHGIAHVIERRDTYSIVTDKVAAGQTYCSLCSRLRRGHLYRIARENGCEAVVLGHHREDIIETFLLNLFYGGRLAAMPPKLLNEDGDLTLLRPLAACAEADLARFSNALEFPIIPCDLCGSQDGLQRQKIKEMVAGWEREQPGRTQVMFRALANTRPSHLLDTGLYDFAALTPGAAESERERGNEGADGDCGAALAMTAKLLLG
ncbi:tRNA 2-thiocytidine biosynthesis protein TtcA [Breoghania corrubedonensis]|uniref:tRNA-cytidine(32) 2-sulfurtransferase n=1 Tax=Breoghania corrubedonensis TaxID=665038 RepID=A0A2T5VDC0_9HYPH|nr:tRNA 2-thiocytidine(32) synthetase TtcA [Breoghania corrubedonensis]PTW61735.1 tRNA 2-thiocytidine biosynthesis protein TtcA [Breoghania corrubedonensis]